SDDSSTTGFSLHGCRHRLLLVDGNFVTHAFARLLQVSADRRPLQIRHIPDLDMTHLLSRALKDSLWIGQIASTHEAQVYVVLNYTDVADAVLHSVCRAVVD